jgi:multisubunit Na+/H+ antiporter MnhC subunit
MSLFKAVIGGGVAAAVYFYAPGALEHEFFSCFQSEAFIKTAKPIAIAVGTALGVTAVVLGVAVLTLSAFYGTLIAGNAFNIDG